METPSHGLLSDDEKKLPPEKQFDLIGERLTGFIKANLDRFRDVGEWIDRNYHYRALLLRKRDAHRELRMSNLRRHTVSYWRKQGVEDRVAQLLEEKKNRNRNRAGLFALECFINSVVDAFWTDYHDAGKRTVLDLRLLKRVEREKVAVWRLILYWIIVEPDLDDYALGITQFESLPWSRPRPNNGRIWMETGPNHTPDQPIPYGDIRLRDRTTRLLLRNQAITVGPPALWTKDTWVALILQSAVVVERWPGLTTDPGAGNRNPSRVLSGAELAQVVTGKSTSRARDVTQFLRLWDFQVVPGKRKGTVDLNRVPASYHIQLKREEKE